MIRLALVGCGAWARRYAAAAGRVSAAEFAAAVDPDHERAAACGRELGAELTSASLGELLADHADAVDAVVISTPNHTHTTLAEQAARAGKHVLVEAPIGLAPSTADAAIDACRTAGVRLMAGASMRFAPAMREVKDCVESGEVGIPGLIRTHRWMAAADHPAHSWQLDPARSGGPFINEAVHEIDLVGWIFGAPPDTVYALAPDFLNAASYLQIHLGYPGGAMAVIDFTTTLPSGDGYRSFNLIGSTGSVYVDDHQNVQLNFRGEHARALVTHGADAAVGAQLQEFVDAVAQDREPSSSAEEGSAALRVAAAAQESAASGRALRRHGDVYEPV